MDIPKIPMPIVASIAIENISYPCWTLEYYTWFHASASDRTVCISAAERSNLLWNADQIRLYVYIIAQVSISPLVNRQRQQTPTLVSASPTRHEPLVVSMPRHSSQYPVS